MEGVSLEFEEGEKQIARYPNKKRYAFPIGFMQGGIKVAAMVNTVSQLSYIVGAPNVTKGIGAPFNRLIKRSDAFIDAITTVSNQFDSGLT